ncbi:OLC1v1006074C1 [Oldenlandia corymbosa var. corymbosa]|uniref:OLC1v1006074C1 n=1 Tax=Oldenlandia corymbosa var. corymbosa TaxID=529605 RepID=A0AAV1DG46_OLDCO|nr:OLC1v1006074C1 [Oldenlandia corymbosa var. corymbosa]
MRLGSPASHLRCTLTHPPKFATLFFSRAFTILHHHHIHSPEILIPPSTIEAFKIHENDDQSNSHVNLRHLAKLQRNGFLCFPREINRVISTCAKLGSYFVGIQIQAHVIKAGFTSNVYINSALVDMYCKCVKVEMGQLLFDEMPERNHVTWNSLISGYLETLCPTTAMCLYIDMLRSGEIITPYGISAALVGSAQLEDGCLGAQLHALGLKNGFEDNVVVGTGLVDMYSKCSSLEASRRVFDGMPHKNVRSWTSMITGYAHNKFPIDAMILIREMFRVGVKANYVTYNSLLCSFCGPGDLDHCREIHCRVVQEGFDANMFVACTLVTAYSECGCSTGDFFKVCSTIKFWDQISWNAVIAGFSNLGIGEEALNCFTQMRRAGISVDLFTYASVLKATGTISALEEGKQIHSLLIKGGYDSDLCARNGLISMFSRCGNLSDAKKVFLLMDEHDVVSWNSLLSGFAHHGFVEETIRIFEEMRRSRVRPNLTTFLIVLSACSHSGLVEKGLQYFELMKNDSSIPPPNLEHYACIVDLCGRAGYLEQAEAFINDMPMNPKAPMLKALLSACQVYGNKEIATRCARRLVEISPSDPATYVVLANILAREGNWNDAEGVRKLMFDRQVMKKPGSSWI